MGRLGGPDYDVRFVGALGTPSSALKLQEFLNLATLACMRAHGCRTGQTSLCRPEVGTVGVGAGAHGLGSLHSSKHIGCSFCQAYQWHGSLPHAITLLTTTRKRPPAPCFNAPTRANTYTLGMATADGTCYPPSRGPPCRSCLASPSVPQPAPATSRTPSTTCARTCPRTPLRVSTTAIVRCGLGEPTSASFANWCSCSACALVEAGS